MLKELNELNYPLEILSIESPLFREYGEVISHDFSDMFTSSMESMTPEGPTYLKDVEPLHKCRSFLFLEEKVFGGVPIQAGICFGNNSKMNGMEYHKSSEVIIAVTDIVLILGNIREIYKKSWDSSLAKCFFVPRGIAIELYGGTLHFAPCRVTSEPFCTVIVLPLGTNSPLKTTEVKKESLLFMNNKWLICHKDSPLVERGAFVGITGENIEIRPIPLE